ncbi:MAG: hypothetical protein Kow0020_14380 [Wenzhouxiangellaceae bacterium]
MTEPRRLATRFVSEKDLTVLRSLLKLVAAQSDSWTLTEATDPDADALLVDVDDEDGAALWPELGLDPPIPIALTRKRSFVAPLILKKPIRINFLVEVLEKAIEFSEQPPLESGWPVLMLDDADGELPLAEHLRRGSWNFPVIIGGEFLPELVIDPGSGSWYSGATDRELAQILRRKLRADEARRLSAAEMVEHVRGLDRHNLSHLKWRAGLALTEGALHPDLAGEVRFMLPQVPLQALSDTAYSRQARLLIREPLSARELLERSNADPRDVAAFLNACHCCGLLLLDRGAKQAG